MSSWTVGKADPLELLVFRFTNHGHETHVDSFSLDYAIFGSVDDRHLLIERADWDYHGPVYG